MVELILAVGVPVIAPVLDEMVKPAGNAGEIVYTSEPVPPEPVTGVKEVAATFLVSTFVATACVAVGAASIVKLKVLDAEAETASVTVTVYVVALNVPEGVPVISPVLDDIDKPAGNAGEIV